MATWDPSVEFPDLTSLNGGTEYTSSSVATPEVFNAMVNALIALHRVTPEGTTMVTISSDYTAYEGSTEVLRVSFSTDNGNTWIPISAQGVITIACPQIRFMLEMFYNGVETLYVTCGSITELNKTQSRFGMSKTPNVVFDPSNPTHVLVIIYSR